MLTFPNAKINIGLNIIEKRADGFHNIESVFYPVDWCDVLEIISLQSPIENFVFTSSGLPISGNIDSNLCVKAYNLLKPLIQNKLTKSTIQMHLHKVIPMGAGMGGGSADGSFTLKMFNEVYELGLTNEELKDFARKLGSDCAFFIENKPVFCYQKGDEFEDFSLSLKGKFIVLVNPNIHISTAEAYAGVTPQKPNISLKTALAEPIENWKNTVINDFEKHLLQKYPTLADIKTILYNQGALYTSMTGSGSTIYGIFDKEIDIKSFFESYTIWQGYFKV